MHSQSRENEQNQVATDLFRCWNIEADLPVELVDVVSGGVAPQAGGKLTPCIPSPMHTEKTSVLALLVRKKNGNADNTSSRSISNIPGAKLPNQPEHQQFRAIRLPKMVLVQYCSEFTGIVISLSHTNHLTCMTRMRSRHPEC